MDSPLSRQPDAPVAPWVVDRIDEHGRRIGTLEREQMGLHKTIHTMETRLSTLAERTTENHALVISQLNQIGQMMQTVRDKQIEQDAAQRTAAMYHKESREQRNEIAGWVRWIAPGAVTVLMILMTLGDKVPK